MIKLFTFSLTLLVFASVVKNGISLPYGEDYPVRDASDSVEEYSKRAPNDHHFLRSLRSDEEEGAVDDEFVGARDTRAPGNHFLRSLRTSQLHFLRSLKKRGVNGEKGKMHFLRALRNSKPGSMRSVEYEQVPEDEGMNFGADETQMERSVRATAPNLHFLRSLREGSAHFLRSLRSPKPTHFLRSLRELRAPEPHFLRALKAPPTHFLRSLREAPEIHFLRSLRSATDGVRETRSHFLRSLRSPGGGKTHFLRSLRQDPQYIDDTEPISSKLGEILPATGEGMSFVDYSDNREQ